MSETIRLPCGVQAVVEFRPSQDPLLRDSWHVAVRGFMSVVDYDRDSAIKWLNEKCVEARAALLPPGARIVEDTPETREKVARRLYELHAQTWKEFNGSVDRPWEDTGLQTRMLGFADAVLAALGVSK